MNRKYCEEILKNFTSIPTPEYPGILAIDGDQTQAIFAYPTESDVFLAASTHGNGRLIASGHDVYYNYFEEKSGLPKIFTDGVKKWLSSGNEISNNQILDMSKFEETESLKDYKIIKWKFDTDIKSEDEVRLLEFIKNGGGLFCGVTPWGYLSMDNENRLDNLSMYHFLKKHFGIRMTENYVKIGTETSVNENKALIKNKGSNKHTAIVFPQDSKKAIIERICEDIDCINQFVDTLDYESLMKEDLSLVHHLRDTLVQKSCPLCCCGNSNLYLAPTKSKPISGEKTQNICRLLNNCFIALNEKPYNVNDFPGECYASTENDVQLTVSTKFPWERVSTGYYLPAGFQAEVKILSGNYTSWKIRIGSQSDNLSKCDKYKRWPIMSIVQKVSNKNFHISSPFGGLIYFDSSVSDTLHLTLSNVVKAPYFDLLHPEFNSDSYWYVSRYASAPWAEIAGRHIIFTVPSDCVKGLQNPRELLEYWDAVVRTHHELRGTDVSDYKRERVVADCQPVVGYMHAGYPIVISLDICYKPMDGAAGIFELDRLRKEGNWGMFHEFGHNMQRGEWTFEGATEVTVNIFSSHAMKHVVGLELNQQPWLLNQKGVFAEYFSQTPNYEKWKIYRFVGIALMTFIQLIKHFGWQSMNRFMKEYETDIKNNAASLPKSNQDKIDQWVIRYSKIVGYNIKPQFEFWGLAVSPSVQSKIGNLREWCPREEKNPNLFFS